MTKTFYLKSKAMRFDLNRSLENKKTGTFTKIVVGTLVLLYVVTRIVVAVSGRIPQPPREANKTDTIVVIVR